MSNSTRLFLNDIILKIHTIEDFDEMRYHVLSALRYLIPSTGEVFYLSDLNMHKLCRPIFWGVDEKLINRYLAEFQTYDHTKWIYDTPTAKVYNDSAFIQSEAANNSEFYRRVHAPVHTKYQITLRIVHNGFFLGVLALCRGEGQKEFTEKEIFNLELLGTHLESRLYDYLIVSNDIPEIANNRFYDLMHNKYMLTARETQIAYMVLGNIDRDQICDKLCISLNTLKKHIGNIYKKVGAGSLTEFQKIVRCAQKQDKI